jgi:hypothetical protein
VPGIADTGRQIVFTDHAADMVEGGGRSCAACAENPREKDAHFWLHLLMPNLIKFHRLEWLRSQSRANPSLLKIPCY